MTYEEIFDGDILVSIKRTDPDGTVHYLPIDPENRDYARYTVWREGRA